MCFPTLCRYGSLMQGCLAADKPVLLVGGSGVAKSAIVKVGQVYQHGPDGTAFLCNIREHPVLYL